MKKYTDFIVIGALLCLTALTVSQRIQTFILGYKISHQEKELSQLKENIRQNEINLSYLQSRQMLCSTATAMKINLSQPKNLQIVRKGDELEQYVAVNEPISEQQPAAAAGKAKPKHRRK